jgi:hypothetical protein
VPLGRAEGRQNGHGVDSNYGSAEGCIADGGRDGNDWGFTCASQPDPLSIKQDHFNLGMSLNVDTEEDSS